MKKTAVIFQYIFLSMLFVSVRALAGGLDEGTTLATTIKTWIFVIVGICALIYVGYNILMAFMERKSWSDVGMSLVYCAGAGGALAGGNYMLSLLS